MFRDMLRGTLGALGSKGNGHRTSALSKFATGALLVGYIAGHVGGVALCGIPLGDVVVAAGSLLLAKAGVQTLKGGIAGARRAQNGPAAAAKNKWEATKAEHKMWEKGRKLLASSPNSPVLQALMYNMRTSKEVAAQKWYATEQDGHLLDDVSRTQQKLVRQYGRTLTREAQSPNPAHRQLAAAEIGNRLGAGVLPSLVGNLSRARSGAHHPVRPMGMGHGG